MNRLVNAPGRVPFVLAGCLFGAFALAGAPAMAQMTPVGVWKTVDDKTGMVKSEIRIVDNGGVLSGRIDKILDPKAKPGEKCIDCKDDRKDLPMLGLEIIRGMKKADGKDVWEDGTVVDPEGGTVYRLKLTPIDGGQKLEVRGFIGFALLGRTQTWIRVQ